MKDKQTNSQILLKAMIDNGGVMTEETLNELGYQMPIDKKRLAVEITRARLLTDKTIKCRHGNKQFPPIYYLEDES